MIGYDDIALAAGSAIVSYLMRPGAAGSTLTSQDLEGSLDAHFEDMKIFTKHIVHSELIFSQTRQVTADCSAVEGSISQFNGHMESKLYSDAARDLRDAKLANNAAIGLSKTLSAEGIPGLVVSGFQGITLASLEAKLKNRPDLFRYFCKRDLLEKQVPFLRSVLDNYMTSLLPENRMSEIKWTRERPQPDVRYGEARRETEFYIVIDGDEKRSLEIDKIENADDWDKLRGIAEQNLAVPLSEIVEFRNKAIQAVQKPTEMALSSWGELGARFR